MATVLYRRSSGEVIKISLINQPFAAVDQTYYGVLTDPPMPDGTDAREKLGDGTLGPLRQVGFSKIWDGSEVRNSTAGEIAGFAGPEIDDINTADAAGALEVLSTHPHFRRAFTAFAKVVMSELNILRAQHGLNPRTLAQLKTAMANAVDKDD